MANSTPAITNAGVGLSGDSWALSNLERTPSWWGW